MSKLFTKTSMIGKKISHYESRKETPSIMEEPNADLEGSLL